uniref:Uncharacterized protein n=1 Tax=Micrurus spixii TaxID=129469 RepID=A0A2D4LD77_9SAUR
MAGDSKDPSLGRFNALPISLLEWKFQDIPSGKKKTFCEEVIETSSFVALIARMSSYNSLSRPPQINVICRYYCPTDCDVLLLNVVKLFFTIAKISCLVYHSNQ